MPLDDPRLAPPAEPTTFPMRGGSRTGLAQASQAKAGVEGPLPFGDVRLTREQHDLLAKFLQEEVLRSLAETSEWRDAVALWREFVDPKPREKSFPWPNASSIFVPLPRIVLDGFKGTIKQTITRQRRRYVAELLGSASALGVEEDKIDDLLRAYEDFAEKISVEPGYLELDRVLDEQVEELLVTGIGPLKLTVETDARDVVTKDSPTDESGRRTARRIVFSLGPRLYAVPVDTFVWPAGLWRSLDEMPWCGHFVWLTASELRRRATGSWNYKNVEEVIKAGAQRGQPSDPGAAQRQEAIRQAPTGDLYRTFDIALLWDLFGDGDVHDIVVTVNIDTALIHRVIYNQAGDGRKPFEVEVASTRSGTVFGRGIIEPIVQPVRAINTAINQTFDSQTLANAPCLLVPEESEAAAILAEGFTPGTTLTYKEEPGEIQLLKFPEPTGTSFTMVQFFVGIIERLTRSGAGQAGEVSAGRRTPASLGLAIQQAGRELADELIDRIRERYGRIVGRAIMLYHEDDPDIFERLLGPERGIMLRDVVERSRADRRSVNEMFRLRLSASSATRSIELERQNALAVAQLLFGYYRQGIELVSMFLQPTTPAAAREILLDILKAAQEQMKRIVELSNQPDSATLVPDMARRLEDALAAPTQPAGQPPPEGVPGEVPGSVPDQAALAAMLGQLGGAGAPA